MQTAFKSLYKTLSLLFLLATVSSCTFHSYFPFICFRKACVNSSLDIKGFKKRMKGKSIAVKRKRGKKPVAGTNPSSGRYSGDAKNGNDSILTVKGQNIDYYRYLLLFRLKKTPNQLDSMLIEHTSQYKAITQLDQARLNYKLDTLPVRNVITVYIKEFYSKVNTQDDPIHLSKGRVRAIRKFLHRAGIPSARIKVLQDSLSPPRL